MKIFLICIVFCITIISYASGQLLVTEDNQISEELDRLFSSQFKQSGIGCATLIAHNGKIIYKKAFGMANLELNIPMKTEHVFRIGSITKQFTSVAILQLFEKGLLDLKDDITKFLPDYPAHGFNISIENLLTHTSGIKDLTEIKDLNIKKDNYSALELIDLFKNQQMDFPPGTKYQYSNSGYILLGYIIEKVSGLTYEQYIISNIFEPLGMDNSFYDNPSKIIKNRANGYLQISDEEVVNAGYLNTSFPFSAGALLMTVEDFFKFHQGLESNKILKRKTLQQARSQFSLNDGTKINYGFGWELTNLYDSRSIQHSGSITGFSAMEIFLPEEDIFVATFCNAQNKNTIGITNVATCLLTNKSITREISIPENIMNSYIGVYKFKLDQPATIKIFKENGSLYFQDSRTSSSWQMHFTSLTDFYCFEVFPNNHIFIITDEGKVTGFLIKAPTYESKITKVE